MNHLFNGDPRLDPRLNGLLRQMPITVENDVESREEMIAEATSREAITNRAAFVNWMDAANGEDVASSRGLRISTHETASLPDQNIIKFQVIRPDTDGVLPCIYYIHGGGMLASSCFYGNYRAWGRILAAKGVAVVMVDFRNAVVASSAAEVAPYPAGLNDCVAGLKWVVANSEMLGVDIRSIVVAGESGGGNLALATALKLKHDGDISLIAGIYALCPYLLGKWPDERFPSSKENNGIGISLHSNRGAMGYGIDAHNASDPMAWPGFATKDDVAGFPPTVVSVNECDPLRDEGIAFYRLLLSAEVSVRGREVLGTIHGTEIFPAICPDISNSTASDIANFARTLHAERSRGD